MSREVCYICRRAKVACLCDRIEPQANSVNVIILQHPDEVSNAKGSAIIAKLGLQQYQCWVGEDFTRHRNLNHLIKTAAADMLVLYPAEQAQGLQLMPVGQVKHLLIIDATWRKAKRIWQINPQLRHLNSAKLVTDKASNYRIRKVPEPGYLSTIEAIVESLRWLECKPQAYQPLLTLFEEMIDFQIKSMGRGAFEQNYKGDDEV